MRLGRMKVNLYFNVVFGWFQDSFTGMELKSDAHMINAGYLKGGEHAGVEIVLEVTSQLYNASKM